MEPTNLTSSSSESGDDARLEAWLHQASPVLPDNGFSQRVLAALPARRSSTAHTLLRLLIAMFAGLAGVAFAAWQIVTSGDTAVIATRFESTMGEIRNALSQSATPALDEGLTLAAVVTACSLFFVFRGNLLRRFRWR